MDYSFLLNARTKSQWQRIGTKPIAGIAVPVFSIFSGQSVGIGEFPDLNLLTDWCEKVGLKIIQLLPMNDVGFSFTPYDAQSSFALDPMYLALDRLVEVDIKSFHSKLAALKQKFPAGKKRVDYGVKRAKLELLFEMFESVAKEPEAMDVFSRDNQFWLEDYAIFKVIKELNAESGWEAWPEKFKVREREAIDSIFSEHEQRFFFWKWLQWQCYEQFHKAKVYANQKKLWLMGDLPFLVARDSADVWANQAYFKLELASGAPPDLYFAEGQRWGMPPYRWDAIEAQDYDYLIQKLQYAENFYDMYRMDHVVGSFRLWTLPAVRDGRAQKAEGVFDPADESVWEEHGKKILSVMIDNTTMLPCGEDLGVIPPCTTETLNQLGIPGMEIQRWMKDWGKTQDFKAKEDYRPLSISILSTHDMSAFEGWWRHEAGTLDEDFVRLLCVRTGFDFAEIKSKVFDPERSSRGRLYWNPALKSTEDLLARLERSAEDAEEFVRNFEATFDERERFLNYLGLDLSKQEDVKGLLRAALREVNKAASIFSVQLLQDLLSLDPTWNEDSWTYRINFPGTMNAENWSVVLPYSLEAMQTLSINEELQKLHRETGRIR